MVTLFPVWAMPETEFLERSKKTVSIPEAFASGIFFYMKGMIKFPALLVYSKDMC